MKLKLKLYWVTTPDHHEDWFAVAKTKRSAQKFFEREEDYEYGDSTAELVLVLDESTHSNVEAGWPSDDLLVSLGAKITKVKQCRVVKLDGRTFAEGMLENQLFEKMDGRELSDGTVVLQPSVPPPFKKEH